MKKIIAISLLLAVLVSGCDKNADPETNPIDSDIIIQTHEVLASNSRKLTLNCATERIYGCINFPLKSTVSTDPNALSITFTGVEFSQICLTALGPAGTTVDLNSIPNGEYPIAINNGSLNNSGLLRISDEKIDLVFGALNGIKFKNPTTRRVPAKTFWVHIGYHAQGSIDLVNAFIQKLEDNGAVFSSQVPGDYYYYSIDPNGNIVTPENLGYYFARSFIFQFDGDEAALKELVSVDGKELKSSLSIRMETYKGEQVNNWSD